MAGALVSAAFVESLWSGTETCHLSRLLTSPLSTTAILWSSVSIEVVEGTGLWDCCALQFFSLQIRALHHRQCCQAEFRT